MLKSTNGYHRIEQAKILRGNRSAIHNIHIETIREWRKMFRKFTLEKYALYASLVLPFIRQGKMNHMWQVFRISPLMVCFEREVMEHYRIVFEKK